MNRSITLALVGLLTLLVQTGRSDAAVVIAPTLPGGTILEGTPSIDFTLSFSGTDLDATALFDAFTYAVEATNSRAGADPVFTKPIEVANLNAQLASWQLVDQSQFGAANQVAGNANAPVGVSVSLPSDVLMFTLDTSGLVAGDVVTINTNLFDVAAVSFEGSPFALDPQQGSFSVVATAIPEPASFAALGFATAGIAVRRRRRV